MAPDCPIDRFVNVVGTDADDVTIRMQPPWTVCNHVLWLATGLYDL